MGCLFPVSRTREDSWSAVNITPTLIQRPVVRATFWMSGTLASFMAMAVGGRELSAGMGTFEILFFRSLTGLVIIGAVLLKRRRRMVWSRSIPVHVIRNLAHFGGQFGWFYGLAFIPLAEVFAIEFTVPVWTALLAALILKERLTLPRVAAVGLGILGMLIILRPGFSVVTPAALAVLGGAVCYALSHTLTRRLAQVDTPVMILFYMTLIQLPLGFVPALPDWVTPAPAMWPWLLVVGVTALSGHYCMARAFVLADATVVVPMDFLRLPFIALVGYLFYGESIDGFLLGGALVMLAGNVINIRAEGTKNGLKKDRS